MNATRWFSDRVVVATAVGAAAGALHPARWALLAGIVLGIVSLIGRRAALIPLAALLVTSGLAQRSLAGLDGVQETLLVGDVTLLTDPEPSFGGHPSGRAGRRPPPGGTGQRRLRTGACRPTGRRGGGAARRGGARRGRRELARQPPRERPAHDPGRRRGAPWAPSGPTGQRPSADPGRGHRDVRPASAVLVHGPRPRRRPSAARGPRGCVPGRRADPPVGRVGPERGLRPGPGGARAPSPAVVAAARRDRCGDRPLRRDDALRTVGAPRVRHGRARRHGRDGRLAGGSSAHHRPRGHRAARGRPAAGAIGRLPALGVRGHRDRGRCSTARQRAPRTARPA